MQTRSSFLRRITLSAAIGLSMASAVALASDSIEVQVSANGTTEVVVLDNLQIGESRQLYSEAGTLVTALRTADGIELDIGGEKTRITMKGAGLGAELATFLRDGKEDAGDRKIRIMRVKRGETGDTTTVDMSDHGEKRVVLLTSVGKIDADNLDDIDAMIEQAGGAEGKRIAVKRRIATDATLAD